MAKYELDWIDGRPVPPLVVAEDFTLVGLHEGSVHVERGSFVLDGVLEGSLVVHRGASASIRGTQEGSVHIENSCVVVVTGAIEGSTHVEPGGQVIIEATGKLAGSLHNNGLVVLRGVFGGSRSGGGEFRIEDDGHVKQPTVKGGVSYYEWTDV
jgi:cytoskeletal protein CcmA (bactofilin family)